MKSLPFIAAVAAILACQAALAQPAPPPERGRGGFGDHRGPRDQLIRHEEARRDGLVPPQDGGMSAPDRRGLSPDERRELRRQIRDHGRDIYRQP